MHVDVSCNIRPLHKDDLKLALSWRNHPEIRFSMLSQNEITLDDHLSWFNKLARDSTKRAYIIESDGSPIGVVNFSGISSLGVTEWGFYTAPNAPKGSGTRLGHTAINYAFNALNQQKICGQVLSYNEASIRLHYKLGFKNEGVLREQHLISEMYHDLICFGLLRREWNSTN